MRRLEIQTLNRGWVDKDKILLHAAFQLLRDYVEEERPERVIDWNADRRHASAPGTARLRRQPLGEAGKSFGIWNALKT